MSVRINLALVILLLLTACQTFSRRPVEDPVLDRFAYRTYNSPDLALPFRISRPENPQPAKKYPLVILFHGAGERGTDNQKTMKHFIPMLKRADFPLDETFVLIPQCPEQQRWVEVDWNLPSHRQPTVPSKPMAAVFKMIQEMMATEPIDTSRIYALGLSMGGFAVWDAMSRWPDLFSAGVPVCGGGDERTAARFISPIWVFHGAKDRVVSADRSRHMVIALQKAGAVVRYTEYPDEAHGSWKPAFLDAGLLSWLFSQQKRR